jgi:hypothetical protein
LVSSYAAVVGLSWALGEHMPERLGWNGTEPPTTDDVLREARAVLPEPLQLDCPTLSEDDLVELETLGSP